jgi:manganese transport protein
LWPRRSSIAAGTYEVAAIQDAYKLLSPLVGAAGASTLFAIALLASGQNSSITGTLAGQVVMEGFIHMKVSPWLRRLITRSLAIIPTIIVVAVTGEQGTEKLLILSQVILSLQLSFAVVPLVMFTGSRKKMGEFVNARWLQGAGLVYGRADRRPERWLLVETAMGPLITPFPDFPGGSHEISAGSNKSKGISSSFFCC